MANFFFLSMEVSNRKGWQESEMQSFDADQLLKETGTNVKKEDRRATGPRTYGTPKGKE